MSLKLRYNSLLQMRFPVAASWPAAKEVRGAINPFSVGSRKAQNDLHVVRFSPESGHRAARLACPLCANRRHTQCSKQRRYSITPCRGGGTSAISLNGRYGTCVDHCGLMPANVITLVHLSIFSAMNLANSSGEFGGAGERPLTNPTTGIVACCARAASGHAVATPPSSDTNSRRLIRSPHRRLGGLEVDHQQPTL